MDLTFVIPKSKQTFSVYPPIGQGYIASYLRANSLDVSMLDFHRSATSYNKMLKELIKINSGFIGFTINTINFNTAKRTISEIQKNNKNIKILVGGPHVSALPKFSLESLNADFAVIGEGEKVTLEIIRRCKIGAGNFSDIPGICFRRRGKVVLNQGCNIIDDLDSLPFPSWDLMPPAMYRDTSGHLFSKRQPVASIITSRGCPHRCRFCASRIVHGTKLRKRSVKNVLDELQLLVKDYGVKEINICDDTFTEDRAHVISICKGIIRLGLGILWRTPVGVRLDTLDQELLGIMKKSGCYQLGLGIESFSKDILAENKKPLTQRSIEDKINLVKSSGIETFGFFIFGLPGETVKSAKKTLNFIRKTMLDYIWITYAIPLPGTDIFHNTYKDSDFDEIDWDRFYFIKPFNTCSLSRKVLKIFFLSSFLIAYFNPRRLWMIIINLRFRHLPKLFRFISKGLIGNILTK